MPSALPRGARFPLTLPVTMCSPPGSASPLSSPSHPEVCSSRMKPSPRIAQLPAGFAPAGPAPTGVDCCEFCYMMGEGDNLQIFILDQFWGRSGHWGMSWTKSQAPLCCSALAFAVQCWQSRGCASLARNSCLFDPLNYRQISSANNPRLANDLQTACGRGFALGASHCVGCVRRVVKSARGTCAGNQRVWDYLCRLKLYS